MRGSKAAVAAQEQDAAQHHARGEWEGYQLDHGNKTPFSERHHRQNTFVVEVAGRCATKVNKGCTSACKHHLCLGWKLNQNL